MPAMTRPGPAGKGARVQRPFRAPVAHVKVYEARAREMGIDYNAYVNYVMSTAHGLTPPVDLGQPEDQEVLFKTA